MDASQLFEFLASAHISRSAKEEPLAHGAASREGSGAQTPRFDLLIIEDLDYYLRSMLVCSSHTSHLLSLSEH